MEINIKLLNDLAKVPTRGDSGAAGYDLYAATTEVVDIAPHATAMIPTDIAMEIPEGYFGAVFARSGIAAKRGLRPANCVGVVDSSYRGNVMVALHNDSYEVQYVQPGERIAQLVILPFAVVDFNVVDELSDTERGAGGFGSTGKL